MKVGYWRLALGAVLASTIAVGCAQDVGDIDRTQPNKLEKALFDDGGEWYFRQTVVDTDFQGSMGIFNANESFLKRVRWVITEDVLYAMSTVEPAEGVTDEFYGDNEQAVGVVAAFPITGHFDVQRSYNASTGEQSNVIAENSSDREWFERDYFRVDWSTNLTDGTGMFGSSFGSLSAANYSVPQEDGAVDPNRTRISEDYIDTVTQHYYEPDIYACYNTFGYDSIYNCEGGIAQVRNSFLRVPEQPTYAPLDYLDQSYLLNDDGTRLLSTYIYDYDLGNGVQMECDPQALEYDRNEFGDATADSCQPATFDMFSRFGYFRTERVKWTEDYGSNVEANRLYYANRWNIWQTVYEYDADGNVTGLLEMKDRKAKPIVYHLNVEYPTDFYDAAAEVARQWDAAFIESVMLATGRDEDAIRGQLQEDYGTDKMYDIVPNSCSGVKLAEWYAENGDTRGLFKDLGSNIEAGFNALPHHDKHMFCAELEMYSKFEYQRVGDLRYSFFNWVEQEVPWLGYGPSANDPLTGELISGNANFNGTAIKTYGPIAADYVQYMNGELSDDRLKMGEHVREILFERDQNARRGALSAEGKQAIARRMGVAPESISPTAFEDRISPKELPEFVLRNGVDKVQKEARRMSESVELSRSFDTRLAEFYSKPAVRDFKMKDPDFLRMVESAAAVEFGPEFNDDDMNSAYMGVSVPQLNIDRYERRNQLFASRNIMSLETMDMMMENIVTYAGVADHFKGASRDEIADYFVKRMFIGTQLHEVGHTVGLRHNFIASTDVLNYHDTYWEIQQAIADGVITPEERWSVPGNKLDQVLSSPGKVGDKDTPGSYLNEAEFRIASVMDYTADFTGRFAGLGKYDQAAINFAYGEVVEVWSPDVMNQLTDYYDSQLWISNYREYPRIMAGVETSGMGTAEEIRRGITNILEGREHIPVAAAKERWRQSLIKNKNNWKEFRTTLSNPDSVEIDIDPTVPYEFCSDEYNGSQLNCTVFDWGANQSEIINHQFNNYRLFQTFRRYNRYRINKLNENINSYANWIASIFAAGSVPFRYYSIYQWYDIGDYTDDLRDAAIDTINFFAEVMATPEARRFCYYDDTTTSLNTYWFYDLDNVYVPANYDRADGQCNGFIDIDRGLGQAYGYDFTDEYDYRVTRVGSFVDKSIAAQMLYSISSDYAFSAFFTDFRATNISYWTLFRNELYDYLRGIILGDYKGFAGVINQGEYEPPMLVDPDAFGKGTPNSQTGMPRVYTPISFGHEFDIIVGAMIANSTWQDRYVDFNQYVKVWVSESERQDVPPGTVIKEFVHPVTNQIYRAPIAADGRSITGDLVDHANMLATRYVEAQDALAAATPGTAQYEGIYQTLEGRSQQLEDTVAKLDMIRFIWAALGPDALR